MSYFSLFVRVADAHLFVGKCVCVCPGSFLTNTGPIEVIYGSFKQILALVGPNKKWWNLDQLIILYNQYCYKSSVLHFLHANIDETGDL